MSGTIAQMPGTVADVLAAAAEGDAVVVIFRVDNGAWRVGWSKMMTADLTLAAKCLDVLVLEDLQAQYRSER